MNNRRSALRPLPILKFLKEGPGYGLVQPVTHLENRIEFSTMFPENHCCMLIILWYNIIRKGKESLKRRYTTMRAKQVYLIGKERCAVQTMISLEIKSNIDCENMGIEPAFETEMLKALYRKLAGFEWKED